MKDKTTVFLGDTVHFASGILANGERVWLAGQVVRAGDESFDAELKTITGERYLFTGRQPDMSWRHG